jgi:hypothetical protein
MLNLEKQIDQLWRSLPKTLFALSQWWVAESNGSRDLLSWSQMHIDERDEVVLAMQ